MFEDVTKRRLAAKWIIGIISTCILIYLGVRHIEHVAGAILWLVNLFKPLLLGAILALILNVPMSVIEQRLFKNSKEIRKMKVRRPLAILLALVLVLGIFVSIAFLVVPELIEAVKFIAKIAVTALDTLAQLEESTDLSQMPLGEYFSKIDIDWIGLRNQLEQWFSGWGGTAVNQAMDTISTVVGNLVTFFIGLVFSIYGLANKELLKRQFCRLIRVWLPHKMSESLLHVLSVCNRTFRHFIVGQATEAVILGTLCMAGMAILRIPYAPMIGALVGVTALIPIVGAFVGTIVGAIMILTVDPFKAFVFVVFLWILQQVEGNLIYPRVVGSKINLPAIWVLAAVTVGGNLSGPLGMLLGVPIASAAYYLLREATNKREVIVKESEKCEDIKQ